MPFGTLAEYECQTGRFMFPVNRNQRFITVLIFTLNTAFYPLHFKKDKAKPTETAQRWR